MVSVFEYLDYRKYLAAWLAAQPNSGRGLKARIAEHIASHPPHVSNVMNGSAHLSLEQAEALSRFIGHSIEESHFFLLIFQQARAGTENLNKYFQNQIAGILDARRDLKSLAQNQKMPEENVLQRYYSSWVHAAIHMLTTIDEYRDVHSLARKVGLPSDETKKILDFLVQHEFLSVKAGKYKPIFERNHLSADRKYPMYNHHTNWRLRAIHNLHSAGRTDLQYSSVVTVSKSDAEKVRALIVENIKQIKQIIKESRAEEIYCFNLDFFEELKTSVL